jgi:catechol 2,3-dioxygenase-like lactoylglutathione lyase family enzyme
MRVTRLHHVSVNTNGAPLDDVVTFYRDVLGLGDHDRPDIPGIPGHWHALVNQQLHVVGAASRGGTGPDPTGHHFCVTVDDLPAAIAELDARSIEYVRGVQGEGTVQIWITDPAGNTIELQQDPTV